MTQIIWRTIVEIRDDYDVSIGSGSGLVPSGSKQLPEPTST